MSPDGPLLKVKRGVVLTIIGFQLIATSTSPYLPKMNARIIDEGAVVGDTSAIWPLGSITLVFALIQGVFPRFYHCFATQLTMGLEHVLRRRQFAHDQTLPSSHLSLFGLPSLTTRNTNPVQQVHMIAMMTMTIMVTAPTMAVGGIVMALRQDTTVSQLLLVVAPPHRKRHSPRDGKTPGSANLIRPPPPDSPRFAMPTPSSFSKMATSSNRETPRNYSKSTEHTRTCTKRSSPDSEQWNSPSLFP